MWCCIWGLERNVEKNQIKRNVSWGVMNIGKVLLIFFEGNEEKVIDSIISALGGGR